MSLTLTPVVWTAHFLAVYIFVSVACPAGFEGIVRPGIAVATAAALAFYGWFWAANRQPAGGDTASFIGAANRLLCILSAIGTAWVALPAFMLAPCAG